MITRAERRQRDIICHRRDCIRAGKAFDRLLCRAILPAVLAAVAAMHWAGWLPGGGA